MAAAAGETEEARARLWQLLGLLLRASPDASILRLVAGVDGDDSPLGRALTALGERALTAEPESVEREYHRLFIGVGRGELLPYASYYLTGFLHEKPLARLRSDMAALGIARAPGQSDPEDHIATLAEIMAGLIAGDLAPALAAGGPAASEQFFNSHIAPWAGGFFADLEGAEASDFYRPVGSIGRQLVEIEATALTLAA